MFLHFVHGSISRCMSLKCFSWFYLRSSFSQYFLSIAAVEWHRPPLNGIDASAIRLHSFPIRSLAFFRIKPLEKLITCICGGALKLDVRHC